MSSIQFNPWVDKIPFGAVPCNKTFCLQIHVSPNIGAKKVELIVREDSSAASKIYNMSLAFHNNQENMDIYSTAFQSEKPGLLFYRFEIHRDNDVLYVGHDDYETKVGPWLTEWQITVYNSQFNTPDRFKGGIMYQIFPDRFKRNTIFQPLKSVSERIRIEDWYSFPNSIITNSQYKGNDFYMGNILGIIDQLPYLKALNVNSIYLNPIFESAENHRYSTGDYKKIDPYLGDDNDFEKLVYLCTKNGISLILDGVFSHTGADSIYFNKFNHYSNNGAYNSKDSPFFPWYTFIEHPDKYSSWWNFENLPNINETEPSYVNFITNPRDGVLSYWQKKGISGWRLDVADELPDPFLDSLRYCVKSSNPEALIIGEVWEDASNKESYGQRRRYLLGDQLDSVMNYPWRKAIIDFLKLKDSRFFYKEIQKTLENYPSCSVDVLMNILSTHDTMRIINALAVEEKVDKKDWPHYQLTPEQYIKGKSLLYFAAFLQFTLPGIPCIYYGDEIGMTGFGDPYCRMGYAYGKEDLDILDFYQRLTALRKTYVDSFKTGFHWIYAENSVVAYQRKNLLCVINLHAKPQYLPYEQCGKIIFGNMDTVCTKFGTIIPPLSFAVIDSQK